MYLEYARVRIYPAAVIVTSMFGSFFSPVYAVEKPRTQEFVVTAYYSPVPNQCCYFRGSYEEEIIFNGEGKNGADGTAVYAGMIAAPPTYDFGTVISLPGLGVGTVHDRGGRIIEWGENIHRIDLWMGVGEEGLARAMAWGVRHVKGTVYPVGTEQVPAENFSLAHIPVDTSMLASLPKSDSVHILSKAVFGGTDYSVRLLQSTLRELGYFNSSASGQFGTVTQDALKQFLTDQGFPGDGTKVNEVTAAALSVAVAIKPQNLPDVSVGLASGSHGSDVRQIQKLMRFLGFYRGRTDGLFDQHLKVSVTAFQMKNGLISHNLEVGAGRVGPATRAEILKDWKSKIVLSKSNSVVTKMRVAAKVRGGGLPGKVLSLGDKGKEVLMLQRFLKTVGYLDPADVTGTFGSRTKAGLLKYQLERKIVTASSAHGAGVFGPSTKMRVAGDAIDLKWKQVRASGIESL